MLCLLHCLADILEQTEKSSADSSSQYTKGSKHTSQMPPRLGNKCQHKSSKGPATQISASGFTAFEMRLIHPPDWLGNQCQCAPQASSGCKLGEWVECRMVMVCYGKGAHEWKDTKPWSWSICLKVMIKLLLCEHMSAEADDLDPGSKDTCPPFRSSCLTNELCSQQMKICLPNE